MDVKKTLPWMFVSIESKALLNVLFSLFIHIFRTFQLIINIYIYFRFKKGAFQCENCNFIFNVFLDFCPQRRPIGNSFFDHIHYLVKIFDY